MPAERPKVLVEPHAEEREPSMGEESARAFLEENHVPPLQDWKPGESVLYLLEGFIQNDTGPFKDMPVSTRPIIARLDSPTFIDLNNRHELGGRVIYPLGNEKGARVDYFAIDAETRKPHIVRSSNRVMTAEDPYYIKKENLFAANDSLFPSGA